MSLFKILTSSKISKYWNYVPEPKTWEQIRYLYFNGKVFILFEQHCLKRCVNFMAILHNKNEFPRLIGIPSNFQWRYIHFFGKWKIEKSYFQAYLIWSFDYSECHKEILFFITFLSLHNRAWFFPYCICHHFPCSNLNRTTC